MDFIIGISLLVLLVAIGLAFISLLIYSFWFRLIVGLLAILAIWGSVTPANETIAWVGTAIIGLGILSPWFIVIIIGGFIAGFFATRR